MLDLSAENKALCFEDSTLKPLYIFIYYWQEDIMHEMGGYWRYFTTIDKDIVLESAEITEGVLEGNNFELGSLVAHSMKLKRWNNGINYENMIAVPVQKIGTQYIAYFDGYVSKETVSGDGQTVSMEINSLLERDLDIDILPGLISSNNMPARNVIYYTLRYAGVEQTFAINDTYSMYINENIEINFDESKLPKQIPLSRFLKQVGEFLGCHIISQEKRVINSIDDMYSYQPSGMCKIAFVRLTNVSTALKTQKEVPYLPSEYIRIPYLQVDGTQYIDTKYVPNINTRVEMEFQNSAEYLNTGNLQTTVLFGSRDGLRKNAFSVWTSVAQLNELKFDVSNIILESIPTNVVGKLKIVAEPLKITVNGNTTQTTPLMENFSGSYPLYLFTNNDAGSPDSRYAVGKLYSFKIFENNVLAIDMIPVATNGSEFGLYDLVNGVFYQTNTQTAIEGFGSNAISYYTPPYYISNYFDKTNFLKFGKAILTTEKRDYSRHLPNNQEIYYSISNNIFYEALSNSSEYTCDKAFLDVWLYLTSLDFYYSEINMMYPPFLESVDCLILNSKNQSKLPSGYCALDNIELGVGSYIDTEIYPYGDNIEIDITFNSLGGSSSILHANEGIGGDTISLYSYGNNLTGDIGRFINESVPASFHIDYLPPNQKVTFNIKCGKRKFEYSGSFSGNGIYYGDDIISIKSNSLRLGAIETKNETPYKLYHFEYFESGKKLCDMCPCMRESDGAIGFYDIVRNIFMLVQGNPNPNYESGNTIVPILSTTTRGIHSMRANILCRATNGNKK